MANLMKDAENGSKVNGNAAKTEFTFCDDSFVYSARTIPKPEIDSVFIYADEYMLNGDS